MSDRLKLAGGALVLALVIAGCDEKLSDVTGPTPNLEPTFSSIQREIFDTTDASGRVACTQCHTTAGGRNLASVAGLNLTSGVSYSNLVSVSSSRRPGAVRVVPGDPENSYLIHKLEGRSDIVGERMPRTSGPFLTQGQIQVIKRWIAIGAPNN
jgi:hypothetical protein